MIELKVSREVIRSAEDYIKRNIDKFAVRGNFDGDFNKKVIGHIGFLIVKDYLRLSNEACSMVVDHAPDEYDFRIDGQNYDLKTRTVAVKPPPYFRCNVPASQVNFDKGKKDYYVFALLKKTRATIWLAGFISYDDFRRGSQWHNAGDHVTASGLKYWCNTFDIEISALKDIAKLRQPDPQYELFTM